MSTNHNIARHKTAIRRTSLSRPIRIAIDSGLINPATTVLDYGCGHGVDVNLLENQGISCTGWDPIFAPMAKRNKTDVVNLGFVLNVIEDQVERRDVLADAWSYSKKILIVSTRHDIERKGTYYQDFGDGFLSRTGTFQKFFTQDELRDFIDRTLDVSSVAVAPGIFLVFRAEEQRQEFLASHYRRRAAAPRKRISDILFEENEDLLQPLTEFVTQRGRLPEPLELKNADSICEIFGSIKKAYRVILRVTGEEQWQRIRVERAQDLLVYIALQKFSGRPKLSQLPHEIRLDIRSFFSTYKNACAESDKLLFSVGNTESLDQKIRQSEMGKKTPSALYCHQSVLENLSPLLRVYEGCAREYIGTVHGANIIKLHKDKFKISYLSYPEFDSDPHPALFAGLTVNLKSFKVRYFNYSKSENPPILHRKEEFVSPGYHLYSKFERLTKQEERYGLYDNTEMIGRKAYWADLVTDKGLRFLGHRLIRSH